MKIDKAYLEKRLKALKDLLEQQSANLNTTIGQIAAIERVAKDLEAPEPKEPPAPTPPPQKPT